MSETTYDPGGKVRLPLQPGVRGDAEFSMCRRYRYWIARWWSEGDDYEPAALWIGMNPSTAEADVDDPTIRKEMHFTRAMGLSLYIKCNVMDYRATHPIELLKIRRGKFSAREPALSTQENLRTIAKMAKDAKVIIAAWGALPKQLREYANEVAGTLYDRELLCMGVTADGSPRHPLYLRNDTQPVVWRNALSVSSRKAPA